MVLKMDNCDNALQKEVFVDKFEKLSLQIEKMAFEVSSMKNKLDKNYKINRFFGLESIKYSEPLEFAPDVLGIGSPTKRYLLNIRAITEEWKGRKNDVLIAIRQQEKETHMDLKALGIRIPITDTKALEKFSKAILSLLYISCELKGIEINDILRDILSEINDDGHKMITEIRSKFVL